MPEKLDLVLGELRELRAELRQALHGPSQDRPGLIVRVDRLEQDSARWARILWIAVTASFGALAAGVRGMFKG